MKPKPLDRVVEKTGTAATDTSVRAGARFTSNPCASGDGWATYRITDLPPAPVFIGSMEDAGLVADSLNKREQR